ncbi:putative Ig domain-containing protein [Spirosoma sp. BT702]|uniref:Ig domain-containing protein n=1 Tax=Spirosoma profusum TaxID=2771354 RepID=A0A927ATH7_9BACT|nr:putative Ig domain-containing protein [Spirosoma profusum]MBD2703545.1 putative Ig domain-containing protein [Spirosoma profusum]
MNSLLLFQQRITSLPVCVLLMVLLTVSIITEAQTIRYVKPTATGTGTGDSWANASSNLQAMIDVNGVQQVWVARGTYKPTTSNDRTIGFKMKNGVTIYGGFAATGTPTFAQRNPTSFTTVLSGDIGTVGTTGDNSYHVVNNDQTGIDNSAVLDGFVIRNGNANGTGNDIEGGGMINVLTSPTVRNCVFISNLASSYGGGMLNYSSSPIVTNCSFLNNSTNQGGGMYNDGSSPGLTNCSFQSNTAITSGGGIYSIGVSSLTVTNCNFQANSANQGGGVFNQGGTPNLTNCSFQNNSAADGGGGIFNAGNGVVTLTNCVLFGNGAINTITNTNSSSNSLTATYCLFESSVTGYSGNSNLTTAILPFVSNTDARLNACSPAINTGNNAANSTTTDLAGSTRVFGSSIDIGAYEYQSAPVTLTVNNPGVTTANAGTSFSQSFSVSGGTTPYSFTLGSGTLPRGLSLSSTGVLSGIPTQSGSFTITVRGTDASGCTNLSSPYVLTVTASGGPIRYVKPTASGSGDGSSWGNASSNLQAMIDLSNSGHEVWVAQGTYKPGGDANTDPNLSFSMKNGVAIYGGFLGNENSLNERPAVNPTTGQPSNSILSGEIGNPGTVEDNSLHVIDNPPGLTQSAVLDGFVITKGYGLRPEQNQYEGGGGVINRGNGNGQLCSPTFQNCLFLENAAGGGGGMSNFGYDGGNSSPVLTNCVFRNNSGLSGYGGGIVNSVYNGGTSNVRISNSLFINNYALFGGGIGNGDGGFTALNLTNCSFIGNESNNGGGALYSYQTSHSFTITNCSFQANIADYGNVIYTSGNVTLTNSVVFNNGPLNQQPIMAHSGGVVTATYTLSDVNLAGTGNIVTTVSPFVSTTSTQLKGCSPAINAGNSAVYNGPATDLAGNTRMFGSTIDMGAYEYQGAPTAISIINPATTTAALGSLFSGTFTATGGSGNYSFSITSGALPTGISLASTGVLGGTPTQTGSYSITVRAVDASGCSGSSATYTLVVNQAVATIAGLAATSNTVCVGSPLTITATIGNVTGSYAFTLTNGASTTTGTTSSTSFSQNMTAAGAGSQTFTLTILASGQQASSTTNVTVNPIPTPTLSANFGGTLTCAHTSLTLTAGGGTTYAFSGPTIVSQNPTAGTAVVSASGTYSVVVTSSGCSATTSVQVSQDSSVPTVSISPSIGTPTGVTLSCATPMVSLSAVGSGTYHWSTGAITSSISATSANTYSVTLTSADGCTATTSIVVSQDNTLPMVSISANPSLTITPGQSATLTASGAATYRWSTEVTTNFIVVNNPGPYSVTGSVGNCFAQASVTVFQTTQPTGSFAITAVTTNSCNQIGVDRYAVGFTPQYAGLNGQPVSVSVVNEMFPTTAPGPYTLLLYNDNPTIVLKAQQAGTVGEVSFSYNWLANCNNPQSNTPPRVNQPLVDQVARVGEGFGYTIPQTAFTDNETPQSLVLSVAGLPAGLNFTPPYQIGGVPGVSGVSSVTVTATDPQGLSVSTSFRLTVVEQTATNTPPTVVNPVSNQVAIVQQPYSLNLATTFTDAQTPNALTLTASGLPTGVSLTGTTLSGTPSQTGTSTVTLTATDPDGLTTNTSFGFTVQPASVTATGPFAITGVNPITCTQLSSNRYAISFMPQYAGLNGQTINFQVVNEMAPTTAPGPYSLQLYNDNPTIVLKASQDGSAGEASFSYNWLATCTNPQPNTPPRVNQPLTNQVAKVGEGFGYTIPQTAFTDNESPQSLVLSVTGLPAGLNFSSPTQIGGVPSVTGVSTVVVTATDPQGLSVSTSFLLTVNPANANNGFAITGVQTLSCVTISANKRAIAFTPQYSGLTGEPVSFSVVNELLPTIASGPYSLTLYTDNVTLQLQAQQGNSTTSYTYNWLAACGSNSRQGIMESGTGLQVRVLGNPVEGDWMRVQISGVSGQKVDLGLVDQQGKLVAKQQLSEAGQTDTVSLPIRGQSGLLILSVQTNQQRQQLKVIIR